jgi:hypothetical protein
MARARTAEAARLGVPAAAAAGSVAEAAAGPAAEAVADVVAAGPEAPPQAAASVAVASTTAIASVAWISLDHRAADTTAAS